MTKLGTVLLKYGLFNGFWSLALGILSFITVAWNTEEWVAPEPYRVLLVGLDEWPNSPPRADSLHLLSLRFSTQSIYILSIPRDTFVEIPGVGYDQINHAVGKGGISLLKATVENLLAVPVEHYAVFRYSAFEKLVDALGGLDVYIERTMKCPNPGKKEETVLSRGNHTLNGKQLLCYIRFRSEPLGDIARVRRQQQVILRLSSKISQTPLLSLLKIYRTIEPFVTSDLTTMDLVLLYHRFAGATLDTQNVFLLPGDFHRLGYWKPRIADARRLAQRIFD
ncbi:MAG: LCP family protein [bacterium JZ-2024 1]